MSVQSVGGISIAYDEYGSGIPFVLLHGHPFNHTMWQDQREALQAICRVITPDLRGYGETTVVPGKTTMAEFARDLAALLDALAIERIILGGLSMGGQIVFEFYRQFPERVRALLLADTQPQVDTEEVRAARYTTAERILAEGMQDFATELLPRLLARETMASQPKVVERVRQMIVNTPPAGAAAALRGRAERQDYTPVLGEIAVPTLIVVGSEDEFTPVQDAQLMHQGIAGSQLAILEGVGHMPNMERPFEFNAVLRKFLLPIISAN
ncbi:alpha/beta fold hydrolase [Ktedonosporobacter rubrisoli]|uniref:Alpha/beta fold hydrolase n=1 Tax=Ktedonosporobacter rubrisoli TaxID=2509675 RepID=A0A4P6JYA4_KTERU|nr:alpha/beta hydrolase [Ktedonosporobacter rubrisoli]QBD80420.1 alpha/beta fold hydrolase [Ktedonosporobacter rubrisoli]